MDGRIGKSRLVDMTEAASLLDLTVEGVRALVGAGYLRSSEDGLDGPRFALGDLKAAYRANFRSIVPGGGPPASPIDTEALRRVRDMAPALLTRPLHPTTLLFLRKTQRLTVPGFIGQVLAERFGGTPASYRRRLRQLDAPDAPRLT